MGSLDPYICTVGIGSRKSDGILAKSKPNISFSSLGFGLSARARNGQAHLSCPLATIAEDDDCAKRDCRHISKIRQASSGTANPTSSTTDKGTEPQINIAVLNGKGTSGEAL